jgi:redox-sensitive bicupin YhaK (pirin superfamily)
MITVRKSADRGQADHGWLKSRHTFSFASYLDPKHVEYRALRVINEDWIEGGKGFGTHPHDNMEIITYIIDGELEHKDSMGTGSVIRRGELQRMTAGTGITHSEFNPSGKDTHLLQIWIHPERTGLKPSYEQKEFPITRQSNELILLASQTGREDSLTIHQDMELHGASLNNGATLDYAVAPGRHVWIQVVSGSISINGIPLDGGDGAALDEESQLIIAAVNACEFLLFDLA